MRLKDRCLATFAAALCMAGVAQTQAQTPAPSAKWMAHCAANLKGEGLKPEVVRRYCACMADVGEEAEMLTWSQTELERSYPPAHAQCHDAARRK
ncbi:MAG: hypothetical protein VX871_01570 [Pseudomonadota bacterium]|nr:hypothetical protein [Pseudomonadota bacterium]